MKLNKKAKTPSKRGGARPRSLQGPRCKVCRDSRLYAITTDLASGASMNAVARKYHFTVPTIWKHVHEHTGAALLEHNLTQPVLDQIRSLNQRTLRILAEAESGKFKDASIALQAIRECRQNLMSIARLTGEDRSQQVANTTIQVSYVDRQLVVSPSTPTAPAIEGD